MGEQSVLFAIKPKYVDMILAGVKDIELRRTRPNFGEGATMLIYSSSPVCAVVGRATVKNVYWLSKNYLWRTHGQRTGVTRAEFDAYYSDVDRGCAIELEGVEPIDSPLTLGQLRRDAPGFRVPQSYCYIRAESDLAAVLTPPDASEHLGVCAS